MSKLPVPINDLVEEYIAAQGQHAEVNAEAQGQHLIIAHTFGMNLVNHPAYDKGRHGQGELFERIIGRVKATHPNCPASRAYFVNAARLYENFPDLSKLRGELEAKGLKQSVNSALKLLAPVHKKVEPEQECLHCPIHCTNEHAMPTDP